MTVEHDPAKTAPATMDEAPMPLWQKIAALGFAVLWAVIVILWHSRATADFYPLDASRVAPNLIASFIIFSLGLIFGALLWPPTRRRLHAFADRKLAPIHEHLAVLRQHHEDSAERQRLILKQNAHIIRSSKTIANEHPDGTDLTTIPEHL